MLNGVLMNELAALLKLFDNVFISIFNVLTLKIGDLLGEAAVVVTGQTCVLRPAALSTRASSSPNAGAI